MVLYVANPEEPKTTKILEVTSKYSKVTRYRLLYKSQMISCILAMNNYDLKLNNAIYPQNEILRYNQYVCVCVCVCMQDLCREITKTDEMNIRKYK